MFQNTIASLELKLIDFVEIETETNYQGGIHKWSETKFQILIPFDDFISWKEN